MKNKRDLLSELTGGFEALAEQRLASSPKLART
jgi:hypothetical protein